ncbi:MAG: site-specific integrase [Chloroflexi bacterium]|nr:site-specific integrase [Chloroflexota bacterium]MQC26897.1 site-specific integrase [Chloroflexota bacterium]
MTAKRGHKEGTIYQRPNGKWRAQISLNGGRLSFTGNTRMEAQEWLRSMRNQAENGLTLKGAKTTYGAFLNEWLATAKQRLAESTNYSYNQLARAYILPSLGKVKLRDLTPTAIQRFYNRLVADGVGLRTVQKTHTVIHASLNAAMKLGLIGRNPDDATQPPKPVHREMRFLTQAEAKHLLRTARETGDRYYALYFTAIVTGMRQGELLGLRWQDVDLEKGIINVKYSLTRSPGGGLKLQKPKTKSSERSVKLGTESVAVLNEQRNRLVHEKSHGLWQDTGHVFPSSVGTALDPTNLNRQFRQLLKKAELHKIRFHDLRHTAASLMLNNGVDVLVASRRLGHAKPSITLDVYGHLLPSIQAEAADVMDNLVAN